MNRHSYHNDERLQRVYERRQAHEQLVTEVQNKQRRQRNMVLGALVLMAAVVSFFMTACSQPAIAAEPSATAIQVEAEPNPINLVGTWNVYDQGYPSAVEFHADGTFSRARSNKRLVSEPVDYGTWTYTDGQLTLVSSDEIENCEGGTTGHYLVKHYAQGGYQFVRVEESCVGRTGFGVGEGYSPLQPSGVFCRAGGAELCAHE